MLWCSPQTARLRHLNLPHHTFQTPWIVPWFLAYVANNSKSMYVCWKFKNAGAKEGFVLTPVKSLCFSSLWSKWGCIVVLKTFSSTFSTSYFFYPSPRSSNIWHNKRFKRPQLKHGGVKGEQPIGLIEGHFEHSDQLCSIWNHECLQVSSD